MFVQKMGLNLFGIILNKERWGREYEIPLVDRILKAKASSNGTKG